MRRTRAVFRLFLGKLRASSGVWFRALLCWLTGAVLLLTGQQSNYDLRFGLRGERPVPNQYLIVEMGKMDSAWQDKSNASNQIRAAKEIIEPTESYFWNPQVWESVLTRVFRANARAAVITLFFSVDTIKNTLTPAQYAFLASNKVFWAAKTDADGLPITPGIATTTGTNIGLVDLTSDLDGRVRALALNSKLMPHLAARIYRTLSKVKQQSIAAFKERPPLINFQGPAHTYSTISFQQLAQGKISPGVLKDKIILFGLSDLPAHVVQTPLGPLSKAELVANILDNFMRDLWITRTPFWLGGLFLLLILLISLWIIFQFPPGAAFTFLAGLLIAVLALSTDLFDQYCTWLSVEAPMAVILSSYIVFTGYRLSETEKAQWKSDRERQFLGELEHLKSNFISLISHDLKTPLAKIQGIADRVLSTRDSLNEEVVKQDIMTIRRTSDELRQYIASILQLTKVEARDIKLRKEVCDFNLIVEEILLRVTPLAREKNITIAAHLDPLFSMELDRTLIGEVVLNLIENAIKYTDYGGKIEIFTAETQDSVTFEVKDNGEGIPEDEIEKIFTKFFRGSGDKTMRVTGTGLGLYLVKYFIELHGGEVFIDSRMGVGTRVGFRLPLEQEEESYAEHSRSHRG